jgi:hypothetical protein
MVLTRTTRNEHDQTEGQRVTFRSLAAPSAHAEAYNPKTPPPTTHGLAPPRELIAPTG